MSKVRNSILNPNYTHTSALFPSKTMVGKVFYIILDDSNPEIFERYGGWQGLGTVFYLPYPESKIYEDYPLEQCRIARPLFPNVKHYPLKEELILVFPLSSPSSQNDSLSKQDYYLTSINLWNNNHYNSQAAYKGGLDKYFKENAGIRPLLSKEGDYIIEGRFGQGLRLGSDNNKPNVWITNNYTYNTSSLNPHSEDINTDQSTILMSSEGEIPIKLSYTGDLDKYKDSQIIINGERIIVNSKKDEILMFGGKGIHFYTDQKIILTALDKVHLDSKRVVLGKGEQFESIMKGDSTNLLLMKVVDLLKKFAVDLTSAVSTPAGTPILTITNAATSLNTSLQPIIQQLENKSLLSEVSYTS